MLFFRNIYCQIFLMLFLQYGKNQKYFSYHIYLCCIFFFFFNLFLHFIDPSSSSSPFQVHLGAGSDIHCTIKVQKNKIQQGLQWYLFCAIGSVGLPWIYNSCLTTRHTYLATIFLLPFSSFPYSPFILLLLLLLLLYLCEIQGFTTVCLLMLYCHAA